MILVYERAHGSSWQRATTLLFTVLISECKADCDTCFTRNFCTKCKSGFYLYSGKCLEKCPDGLEANNHTMECTTIGESGPHALPCLLRGDVGSKEGMITKEVQLKMKMFFVTRCTPQHKKLKVFSKSATSQEAQTWLCPTNTALLLRAILPE